MACNLHLHTELSVLDGAIRIDELVQYVQELKMNAVAITDHGNMHGVLSFYKSCRAAGVNPILGVEAYCTINPDDSPEKTRDNEHLVLLAQNNEGYRNLNWLISNANLHNFYYKPRIWYENFKTHGNGLIALTACLGNGIAQRLKFDAGANEITSGQEEALEHLLYLVELFPGRLYLELQKNEEQKQPVFNEWLLKTGRRKRLPFVVTTDAHFLRKEEYRLHTLLMAMQFRKKLDVYEKMSEKKYGPGYYVKSSEELQLLAEELGAPEAADNTQKIADQCHVEIELGRHAFPVFDIKKAEDYDEFLEWRTENAR